MGEWVGRSVEQRSKREGDMKKRRFMLLCSVSNFICLFVFCSFVCLVVRSFGRSVGWSVSQSVINAEQMSRREGVMKNRKFML